MITQRTAAGFSIALVVAAALAATAPATVDAQTTCAPHITNWTSFDVPGAGGGLLAGTQPAAINDYDEIAGTYADEYLVHHGFLRFANGVIVSFDPPNVSTTHGGGGTSVAGLNIQGQIVGSYTDTKFVQHGFIRWVGGSFTTVDDPAPSAAATGLSSINDWGVAVGFWSTADGGMTQGFVRHVDGSITNVAVSSPLSSFSAINGWGEAAGSSGTGTGSSGLLRFANGTLVTYAPPQALFVDATGININGITAGNYVSAQGLSTGFLRYSGGSFTTVSPSGPPYNEIRLTSINNLGTVVGEATSYTAGPQGFARLANGTRVPVNAPGAHLQTTPASINDRGVLTGLWIDGQSNIHGFVATLVSCN